jgi:hypothetical protein
MTSLHACLNWCEIGDDSVALPIIKSGDVFDIQTKAGFAYLQCVRETTKIDCETVRVLQGTFTNFSCANLDQLIKKPEMFFIQFPLKYAVKKKIVRIVGNYPIPQSVRVPRYYRSKHIIRGEFLGWHIVDSETNKRELVQELTDDQMELSPNGMWNDTLLVERIEQGWTLKSWK